MQESPLTSTVLFHLGPIAITRPVVTTWAIMLALAVVCRLVTRRLKMQPDERQAVLEIIVTGIEQQIEEVIRKDARPFLPMLGTLFIFLVVANLSGVLPGVEAPTSKIGDAGGTGAHRVFLRALLRHSFARAWRLPRQLCRAETHHAAA